MHTPRAIIVGFLAVAFTTFLVLPVSAADATFTPLPIPELSCEETADPLFAADLDSGYGAAATNRYDAELTFGFGRMAEATATTSRMRCIAGGLTPEGSISSMGGYFAYEYIAPDREQQFLTDTASRTLLSFDTRIGAVQLVFAEAFDGPPSFEYTMFENGYFYTVGRYAHFNDYQTLFDFENPAANAPQPADVDIAQFAYMRDQVVAAEMLLQPEPEPTPEPTQTAADAAPKTPKAQNPPAPTFDTPSTFSTLTRFGDIDLSPARVATVTATAIVFAALLALPTRLLQISVTERYARALARFRAATSNRVGWLRRTADWFASLPRALKLTLGLALASLITGFLSPTFGVNTESVRVFGSILIGNVIEATVLFGLLLILLKRSGAKASLSLRLGSLMIVITSVLLSRLTGLEPGVVFGLVLALVISSHGSLRSSRIALIEWCILLILGLAAWMLYSAIPAPEPSGNNPWTLLTLELLASLTIGALAALPIAYLPFSGLPGQRIVEGKGGWWLWGGVYAIGLTVFFTVILPFPGSFAEISTPFATWLGLFVGYALIAVVAFLASVRKGAG